MNTLTLYNTCLERHNLMAIKSENSLVVMWQNPSRCWPSELPHRLLLFLPLSAPFCHPCLLMFLPVYSKDRDKKRWDTREGGCAEVLVILKGNERAWKHRGLVPNMWTSDGQAQKKVVLLSWSYVSCLSQPRIVPKIHCLYQIQANSMSTNVMKRSISVGASQQVHPSQHACKPHPRDHEYSFFNAKPIRVKVHAFKGNQLLPYSQLLPATPLIFIEVMNS